MPQKIFEPIPQRLEILFGQRDFAHQAPWTQWLREIGAEIVLKSRWQNGEIFVLSESTLLIDRHRAVILTCGQAEPLAMLDSIPVDEMTAWRWSKFDPIHSHNTGASEQVLQRWQTKGLRQIAFNGYDYCSWGKFDDSLTVEFNFGGVEDSDAFISASSAKPMEVIALMNEHGLRFPISSSETTEQIYQFEPHGLTLHFVHHEKQVFIHWSPEFGQLNIEARSAADAPFLLNSMSFARDLARKLKVQHAEYTVIRGDAVEFECVKTV